MTMKLEKITPKKYRKRNHKNASKQNFKNGEMFWLSR